MICPRCGANANGRKFCGDCGSPLPWQCAACGSENPPGKRFCGDCGAAGAAWPIALQPHATIFATSAPERRQLTILFADLVASTALGARLDPEDLREVIVTYHGCVTGLVSRFGGFVARLMGDGVLVYFGYPQAHEDDAERAMRAGLVIAEAVGRLDTIAGPPGTLSTRVGIATGVAIVGDLIGSGASLESAAVGETPNLAAALQTVAEPGMVVVAEATRRLAGGLFEYRDLGLANLKGLSTPVRVWAVLSESAIDNRFEALHPSQMPLVGRAEEIELLLRRWEQAKTGDGRVVLLSGEPGIGKSRLIAALEQKVCGTPHAFVHLLCSTHYQDTPLHPVIRWMERAANVKHDDPPAAKLERLGRSLASSGADIDVLADLLSIPGAAEDFLATRTPQQRKEMTFAAILRQFESLTRRAPVLSVVEDIHWADPTTLDLLNLLIEMVERLPMLLVITARPELWPFWATRPQVTVQFLNAFNRREAASLIKEVIGDRILPKDVIDRIIAHADGVPLFIEELTKTVLERDLLHQGGARLSAFEPLSADAVPTSLQASLMARLDALPTSKEVAQIGSVIGRDFSFELLQALSSLPAKRLEQTLGELVQAGLILVRGKPPEATYTFKHALVQDAAYASVLRDRRRMIHLGVAETLEKNTAGPATTELPLLAWHFAEAGARERSIDYYLKSAERTTGRFAFAEMVSQLHKGLQQLEHLPDSGETRRRELALQVALGRALIDHRGSGSEEVREAFERARELCLALGDTKQLLRVFDGLVLNYHFAHSEPKKMLSYATELLELAQRTGDPQSLLWARRSRSSANLLLGRFEEARDEMQRVIDMYKEEQYGLEHPRMARDPKVSTCALLGICLTAMGYPDSGAAASLEGVRHAETVDHVVSLILGLRRACVQRMMQRNTNGVLDHSKRLLAVNTQYETFLGTREGTIFHGWAQLQTRHDATLIHDTQTSLDELEAAKHWVFLPFLMASVAEVRSHYGDLDGAAGLLDRAAELVRLTGEQWCEAEIIRLQARFSTRDPDEAATLLETSLAKAKEQGARFWELRTATSLAELWRDQGRRAAAREMLAPVYAWFTEGFGTPDLAAARALLDDLGQSRGR